MTIAEIRQRIRRRKSIKAVAPRTGAPGQGKPDKQILKSTFVMGGSSIIHSLLGVVRTKVIALLLGPSGMGLAGIYMTITSLISTFSGMGIGESGVRQIAGAFGSGDEKTIAKTVLTIKRTALISGIAGLGLLFFFSSSVSRLTFGNASHQQDIAILSLTIFFAAVSSGQTALIQGLRRIADLAKVSIFGALLGTISSIPIIYWFGEKGIPLYLLVVSAMTILSSWWYSGKIAVPAIQVGWRESIAEARPLLKLGLALMLGSLMIAGTQYVLRVLVVRYLGLSAAGVYHASTTLSLIYVGFILNAMLTDFYPRLSAAAHDDHECTFLINKQVEIGLLLAVPGILAIMTFAPFVIAIFYSSDFMPAVDILRWQILGVFLQVVAWPMGFLLRAKGNGKLFFWTELFANALHLLFAWLGITYFGLPGLGMAFFGMNLAYLVLIFCIVKVYYKFSFATTNLQAMSWLVVTMAVVFVAPYVLPTYVELIMNTGISIIVGLFSVRTLMHHTDAKMPAFLLRFKGSSP